MVCPLAAVLAVAALALAGEEQFPGDLAEGRDLRGRGWSGIETLGDAGADGLSLLPGLDEADIGDRAEAESLPPAVAVS